MLGRDRAAQQAQQVEVVGNMAITLQVSVLALAGPFRAGVAVQFAQPFTDPTVGQEPAIFARAAGQFERDT
ncbi:hypothetical protein D3C77_778460 [compost metagenome]